MGVRVQARAFVLVLVVAAAAACGGSQGPADPQEAVVDAIERTVEDAFAFDATVGLDGAVREEIIGADELAGRVVDGLRVSGAVDAERARVTVSALGVEVFEMRTTDPEHTYVRLRLAEVMAAADRPFEPVEDDAGFMPPTMAAALEAIQSGEWIELRGDPEALNQPMAPGMPDPTEYQTMAEELFGEDTGVFVERFTDVTEATGSGVDAPRRFEIALRLRALAEAWLVLFERLMQDAAGGIGAALPTDELATAVDELPTSLPVADLTVRERVLEEVRVDFLRIAREAGAERVPDGTAELVVTLSGHGQRLEVSEPEATHVIDLNELADEMGGSFFPLSGLGALGFMLGGASGGGSVVSEVETIEVPLEPATPGG